MGRPPKLPVSSTVFDDFWLYNKKTKSGVMQNTDIWFDTSLSTLKGGQSERRFIYTIENQVNYGQAYACSLTSFLYCGLAFWSHEAAELGCAAARPDGRRAVCATPGLARPGQAGLACRAVPGQARPSWAKLGWTAAQPGAAQSHPAQPGPARGSCTTTTRR